MNKPREKPIPEEKIKAVSEMADKINSSKTVLIASCAGLPSSQFQEIKKRLREKADVKVLRKSSFSRAIDQTKKGSIQNLKKELVPNFAVFFSDLDAFELSGILSEIQSRTKAKPGQTAPEDVFVEPGPTELPPGPAISELSGVGLKVSVKDGKLEIIKGATIVRAGEEIRENVASVMGKLGIEPMKVGFEPLAAYDAEEDKIYTEIKINKEATLEELKELIKKALGFAVNVSYPAKENISYFIAMASAEEKTLDKITGEKPKDVEKIQEEETPQDNEERETEKAKEETQNLELGQEEGKNESKDNSEKDTEDGKPGNGGDKQQDSINNSDNKNQKDTREEQ